MSYWLSRTYGLWYANPRSPSWWTKKFGISGFMSYQSYGLGYQLYCVRTRPIKPLTQVFVLVFLSTFGYSDYLA